MLEYIKGTLEDVLIDGIVMENNNMAYRIYTSAQIFNHLPPIGREMIIYLHMHVKEDDISLYGFLTKEERNMYRQLTSVSGVGPKAAMGILSVHKTNDIIWSIIGEDIKSLTKAPGIGKKTAQRIILELKDKLKTEDVVHTQDVQLPTDSSIIQNEAIEALIALGYQSSQAHKIVRSIYEDEMNVESLIKEALKFLASQ